MRIFGEENKEKCIQYVDDVFHKYDVNNSGDLSYDGTVLKLFIKNSDTVPYIYLLLNELYYKLE